MNKYGLLCVLALAVSPPALAMPVYDVQAGFLVGIQNVDVGGSSYNVVFRDGVLQDQFNLANPFTFTTAQQAANASQALSLALQDVIDGNFDTEPTLLTGCAADNCIIHTPYLFDFGFVSTQWFRNAANELDDELGSSDLAPMFDSLGEAVIYADWTLVPVPPAILLLFSGLAALGVSRKR